MPAAAGGNFRMAGSSAQDAVDERIGDWALAEKVITSQLAATPVRAAGYSPKWIRFVSTSRPAGTYLRVLTQDCR